MIPDQLFILIIGAAATGAYLLSAAYQKRKQGYADHRVAYRFARGAIVTFIVLLVLSAIWHLAAPS